MIRRHLILRVVVPAVTVAAVVAPGASAMPTRDVCSTRVATKHHHVHPAARVEAAAHADTMRRIGARNARRSG
jgi:hypothetical protein